MKSIKNNIIPGLLAIVVFTSCSNGSNNDAVISGKVSNAQAGTTLYLQSLGVSNVEVIDSVKLEENGEFAFNPKPGAKTFYRLMKGEEAGVLLLIDSTEKVSLELNADNFSAGYTVEGSKDSRLLSELSNIAHESFKAKDSLNNLYKQNYANLTPEMVKGFSETLNKIDSNLQVKLTSLIKSNSNSLACLAAIEQLDFDQNLETYQLLDKHLGESHGNSPYFTSFHNKFVFNSKLAVGSTAPDIILPGPDGNTKSLYDLKGKVVLIDFWASWCKPCRAENPNVVRMYNEYKDDNFEIFGVSLDRERNAWVEAIKSDQMDWVHVSDLMFWQSPVVGLYNVQGIPHTVLINEEGKIIGKNLRGKDLENKLKELFG